MFDCSFAPFRTEAGSLIYFPNNGFPESMDVVSVESIASTMSLPEYRFTCIPRRWMPCDKVGMATRLEAKDVIYNKPATIVLWEDGTKTVVKCDERDEYDPKIGLALCYMKKALGNSSRALNDVLKKWSVEHD